MSAGPFTTAKEVEMLGASLLDAIREIVAAAIAEHERKQAEAAAEAIEAASARLGALMDAMQARRETDTAPRATATEAQPQESPRKSRFFADDPEATEVQRYHFAIEILFGELRRIDPDSTALNYATRALGPLADAIIKPVFDRAEEHRVRELAREAAVAKR